MNRDLRTYNRFFAIDVDPQKDFCPGGSLAVDHGDDVIEPLNTMNEYVYRQGGTIIITGDQHPVGTKHFDTWPVHCVAGTDGAAFHKDLILKPGFLFIDKGMGDEDGYSGFDGITRDGLTLEQIITPENPHDRTAVLLGGLALDYCVLATALDAAAMAKRRQREARNAVMDIYVLTDATRAVNLNPEDGARALERMQAAGVNLITTERLGRRT